MTEATARTLTGLAAALALLASGPALADTKVSAMTSGGTVQTTDQIPAVRGGANVRVTVAASAATDTTNATNITSGTLPAARLPGPSATTLGGTLSIAPLARNYLTGISTSGVPSQAQPAFTDLSGGIATGQMNGGTGASGATFWRGDGTWAAVPGGGSSPGGTSGQLQYNNAGSLGGFTLSGDCSLVVGTGVITCGKTGGVGFAASATTDTTNASNLTAGTLAAARLPTPTAATLGGVQSSAAVPNNFLTGITTLGVPTYAQPSFAGVSGTAAVAQGGTGVTAAQGNGTKVQLSTGATTANDCAKFDAGGNTVDAGAACGGSSSTPVTTVAASGSSQAIAFPASGNAAYDVTLTANCTFTLSGGTAGQYQTVVLVLRQDATAGRTATLPAGIKWSGGTAPTPNTAAGRVDVFRLSTSDGGATYFGAY